MEPTPPSSGPPATWYRKRAYHHGNLRESALARAREIVAQRGPIGLTLRGLARDLGVTAPALVHVFGSLVHLRTAVAESVLEEMETACGVACTQERQRTAADVAKDWVAYAAANAHLYRLACGEGWHLQRRVPRGYNGPLSIPSPRLLLENALMWRTHGPRKPRGDAARSRSLAVALHGLALARIDGVPAPEIDAGLARAVALAS